ncbi:MAG: haloacid dehalogenase-like hydrolase [Alistipes sp.]|nr:haloacid dehalogenase-like hydrolase [Alistipes sp.]
METTVTVALIYDFDGTLSPGNMQEYDFIPTVGKSNREFWQDSNDLALEQDADPILAYMYKMLHEARSTGLSLRRDAFVASGAKISLYDGVEEWFGRINAYAAGQGVTVHHYINSSGLKEMIEGTPIAHEFRKIYACSFLYDVDGVAYWPAVAVNYTNKTQFIFKINKGVESVYDSKEVNRYIPESQRPVQFRHMIYFGDGTTDIPCMRLVKAQGGHSIAVYNPANKATRTASERLVRDNRVNFVCPADYTESSDIDRVVKTVIDKIVSDRKLELLRSEIPTK